MHLSRIQRVFLLVALTAMSGHIQSARAEHVHNVTTSSQLEELRIGKIGFGIDTILVEATAQTNVLILPKYFWSYPYNRIIFTDAKSNQITLEPNKRKTKATFRAGHALSIGLPIVFKEYEIDFLEKATIDPTDIQSLLGWRFAERLVVNDEHDLVSRLAQRTTDLKTLDKLKSLTINVHKSSYKGLRVQTFLQTLPALESATFVTKRPLGLNELQLKEFLKLQTIPEKWSQTVNEVGVVYKLKQKESVFRKIINFFKKLFSPKQ